MWAVVAPSAFLIVPQRVHAQYAVQIVGDSSPTSIKRTLETTITAIRTTLIQVSAHTSAWAANADWVMNYILKPLAFIMSGKLIKMMTAGVIAYVIGKANGTGIPQFVLDVQKSVRGVSDGAALAYLKQIGNTGSPFSGSIASALSTDYLTGSSLEGFWAANMCTLERSSQNVPAYLAGDWSQGGVGAWFALTTQTQNNPYMLYSNAKNRLGTVIGPGVGGVTGARAAQLSWGQGFLSWCGATGTLNDGIPVGVAAPAPAGTALALPGGGINPGDPCMKSDGTPGSIQTPGSLIKATLNKVLGAQQDQIVRMGDVSGQINGILGNIATVFNTVNFAGQLLGGGSSGGLISAGAPSPSGSSEALSQLQDMSTMGLSESGVVQSASASDTNELVTGASVVDRVNKYKAAWNTILVAANTASTSVTSLATFCTAAANAPWSPSWNDESGDAHSIFVSKALAQAAETPSVLATEIAPIISQATANTAPEKFASTIMMAQKVQTDLSSGSDAYVADLQALQLMPPTQSDIADALISAEVFNSAVATPPGSLKVTADNSATIIDRMNLISTNAQALKTSVCTYHPSMFWNIGN